MMKLMLITIITIFSNNIEYGPYIDILTDTTISLRYSLKTPKQSWFSWGLSPKCDMYLTYFGPQNKVTTNLYSLQSDKEYCYNIYLEVDNSTFSYIASSSTFKTFNKSTSTEFNFLVFTDLNKNYQEVVENLNLTIDSKTVLAILYSEIGQDYQLNYFYNYSKFISKIPFYLPLTENNMDEQYKNPKKNFQNLFRFSYNGNPPYYYYVDVANTRFIFIDLIKSNFNKSFYIKQMEWLENIALISNKDWIFIITNTKISNKENNPQIVSLLDRLKKYRVDLIIEHGQIDYSRSKKYFDNDEIIIISIGKSNEYDLNTEQLDFHSNKNGILKVTISSRKMELYYISQNNTIDHLVYQK